MQAVFRAIEGDGLSRRITWRLYFRVDRFRDTMSKWIMIRTLLKETQQVVPNSRVIFTEKSQFLARDQASCANEPRISHFHFITFASSTIISDYNLPTDCQSFVSI